MTDLGSPPKKQANEDDELEAILRDVPRGAWALAGTSVFLLLSLWLIFTLFIVLGREPVG